MLYENNNTIRIQRFALYLYLFSLNFEIFNLLGLGSTSRLTGILYLLTILPNYQRFFDTSYIKSYLYSLFLFFGILSIISLIFINPYSNSFFDTTVLLNIFLFWVMVNHERADPKVLQKGMLAFAMGGIFLTILYNLGFGIEYSGGRVSIFGDNENAIAVRQSIAIIVLIFFAINSSSIFRLWRFIFLLPIPAMLYFMFETGSRKAFVGFAFAFIIGTIMQRTKWWWHKVIILAFSAAASFFIIQLLSDVAILFNRLLKTTEHGSLGGREEIWSTILPLIKENPIFGVGKTGYHMFSLQSFGIIKSPHNVILEVLAYTGFLGLLLYGYFILKSTLQAMRGYAINGFSLPLLLLIPIWGLIFGGQALNVKIVWAVFAFATSTIFYFKEKNENPLRY